MCTVKTRDSNSRVIKSEPHIAVKSVSIDRQPKTMKAEPESKTKVEAPCPTASPYSGCRGLRKRP
jgi:hypothetical protein